MRPLEILLSLANLLTCCMMAIPQLRATYWIGYVAAITVLIAGIQILFEGSRWEMVPAYALTIIIFFIWLLGLVKPHDIHVNRFIAGGGVGLAVLVLVASFALPTFSPFSTFPNQVDHTRSVR